MATSHMTFLALSYKFKTGFGKEDNLVYKLAPQ